MNRRENHHTLPVRGAASGSGAEFSAPVPLTFGQKIIYALGQLGWSLASYGVANLINYFYMPPGEGSSGMFPAYIFQGAVFGIITIVGLLNATGRVFDAVTDPLIAGFSDRSRNRFGKRKIFMLAGGLPFAVLSLLVFVPPSGGPGALNVIWLAVTLSLFYFFMTVYVVPYTALISEYGHTPEERLNLSTMISVTWAVGFALGNQVYALQGLFERTMTSASAFQTSLAIFAGVSLVLMYLPVFFIDERKHAAPHVSTEPPFRAMRTALGNRNFFRYILSDFMYWLALTFIQTGIGYYITLLLGLDKGFASLLMTALFLLSFAFYIPVNLLAKKAGKKAVLTAAFVVFTVVFAIVFSLGALPFPRIVQALVLAALAAFPMAAFGILPNVIIADIAEADGIVRGNYKAGVFFGTRSLVMKLGISVANLIFPSLLLFGRTAADPLGVRLTGVVAGVFCVCGLLLFLRYDEKGVRAVLRSKAQP